ncbi:MAG: hypothetical protein JXX29_03230 [Deltaproteobacteria bacterium]|nr:hypothetical protein [Deltaproteobacteria bacterium]MBN2670654.1 hypothetical protein [Deltaproteobacteria bacterium]
MSNTETHMVMKRILSCEIAAFATIIGLLWANELLDIPHLLFNSGKTPVNWRESAVESGCVLILGAWTILLTRNLFRRIRTLEGILPVCAACKKIRDKNGEWLQIESYISDRSDASFSHGICPDCAAELYPDVHLTHK